MGTFYASDDRSCALYLVLLIFPPVKFRYDVVFPTTVSLSQFSVPSLSAFPPWRGFTFPGPTPTQLVSNSV